MHVAHGRADLRVGVGGEVLHQEVDQPAVALQEREHLGRAMSRIGRRGAGGGGAAGGATGGAGPTSVATTSSGSSPLPRMENQALNARERRLPNEIIL